ncbi:MAG: protein kinase [Acidobacteriota bacterium]
MTDPSHLGRYRIVSKLGAGAMGDVFLAEDPQIDRQLAIKTVKLHGSQDEVEVRKQRMLVEARAAGRLVHPHVVTLFDAGEDGGTVYLVFEFVSGQDLSARLRADEPVSLAEALQVVRQTASALHHAHRQGIVHRDIKPSNIMLTDEGEAKVGDFGIAKLNNQETELTTTGMLIGTPHYMSPEQVRGETLDGRSDVFSLGSVLFELLHRRRPFPSETLTTLVYQILHEDPTSGLRGNLPTELANLLRKMLTKDLDERLDAGSVAQEIQRIEGSMAAEQLAHAAWTVEGVGVPSPPPAPATPAATQPPPAATKAPAPPPPPSTPVQATAQPVPPPAQSTSTLSAGSAGGRRWLPFVAAAGCLSIFALGAIAGGVLWFSGRDQPASVTQTAEEEQLAQLDVPGESLEDSAITSPDESLAADGEESVEELSAEPADEEAAPIEVRVKDEPVQAPKPTVRRDPPRRQPTAIAQAAPSPVAEKPEPAPAAVEPEPERPAPAPKEDLSGLVVDQELDVATAVGFRIKPDDAFVLFRRPGESRLTNIGRARNYDMKRKKRGAFTLPGPGAYLVVLRREGYADHRIRLHAKEGSEPTLIEVTLGN